MTGANALVTLLALEEHARAAGGSTELAFMMVNDTRSLVEYRQAALHVPGRGVVAVSGVAELDRHGPFALWLNKAFSALKTSEASRVDANSLPKDLAAEWSDWLPANGVAVPLGAAKGEPAASLLFTRDTPWTDAEITLLQRIAATYGFAWSVWDKPPAVAGWMARIKGIPRWKAKVAAAVFLILIFPVRLSVLAPAEVVGRDPAVVRAAMDGVVEKVLVRPNQDVTEAQPLVELDRTTLVGRRDVAAKALATAEAELDQATQQAFFDPKAKAQLAVAKGRIEQKNAELAQMEEQLTRSRMLSPRSGRVVMDDPSEWVGRPVSVGERILAVADPKDVEVEAWLAPADVIALEPGDPVTLFLNTDPLDPVSAHLLYVTYEATLQPDGTLGHRVRAELEEGEGAPRLGLKGTARLDGDHVPLVYWLMRRPLAAIRQMLGV